MYIYIYIHIYTYIYICITEWWFIAYLGSQAATTPKFSPHYCRSIYVFIFIYWVHPIYLYRYLCIGWDTGLLHTLGRQDQRGGALRTLEDSLR